jgi:hypothetical protein
MVAQNPQPRRTPLFPLGQVVATPGALAALERSGQQPDAFLDRHVVGDWGNVCDDDKKLNDAALKDGTRVLSSYKTTADETIWIVTEADRGSTTLLLPDEY